MQIFETSAQAAEWLERHSDINCRQILRDAAVCTDSIDFVLNKFFENGSIDLETLRSATAVMDAHHKQTLRDVAGQLGHTLPYFRHSTRAMRKSRRA